MIEIPIRLAREARARDQPREARAERAEGHGQADVRRSAPAGSCSALRGLDRSRRDRLLLPDPRPRRAAGRARARDPRARGAAGRGVVRDARHPRHVVRGRRAISIAALAIARTRRERRAPAGTRARRRRARQSLVLASVRARAHAARRRSTREITACDRVLRAARRSRPRVSRARLRRLAGDARRARAARLSLRLVGVSVAGLLRGEGGGDGAARARCAGRAVP